MALDIWSSESRHNRRVETELPVRFRFCEDLDGPFQLGHTTNFSLRGVAFTTDQALPITACLELRIVLPPEDKEVQLRGSLVRVVKELPGTGGWEYAVEIDRNSISHPQLLARFVHAMDVGPYLKRMADEDASALHLAVGSPPIMRVGSALQEMTREPLSASTVAQLVFGILSREERRQLARNRSHSVTLCLPQVGRWRANVYHQKGYVEAVFLRLGDTPPATSELGLPESVRTMVLSGNGLLAVAGGPRSGKSTTVASLVSALNEEQTKVIACLEDPIEYVHRNDRSIIKQCEVGQDVLTFSQGLAQFVRQDPDVLVLGAVPDFETLELALRIADTGRLVIAILPGFDATQVLENMLSFYPRSERFRALGLMARSLRGIVCQHLLPRSDGAGQALAVEVLPVTEAIRNALAMNKVDQVPHLLPGTPGSLSLEVSLRNLVAQNKVSLTTAQRVAPAPEQLRGDRR